MGPANEQQQQPEQRDDPQAPNGETPSRRPRSAWTRLAIMFPVFLVVMIVTAPINNAASGGPVTALLVGVGTAALALWCYVALVRRLEHRRTTELVLAEATPGAVTFTLRSPDGDMGYPAALDVTARYEFIAPATLA